MLHVSDLIFQEVATSPRFRFFKEQVAKVQCFKEQVVNVQCFKEQVAKVQSFKEHFLLFQ